MTQVAWTEMATTCTAVALRFGVTAKDVGGLQGWPAIEEGAVLLARLSDDQGLLVEVTPVLKGDAGQGCPTTSA